MILDTHTLWSSVVGALVTLHIGYIILGMHTHWAPRCGGAQDTSTRPRHQYEVESERLLHRHTGSVLHVKLNYVAGWTGNQLYHTEHASLLVLSLLVKLGHFLKGNKGVLKQAN